MKLGQKWSILSRFGPKLVDFEAKMVEFGVIWRRFGGDLEAKKCPGQGGGVPCRGNQMLHQIEEKEYAAGWKAARGLLW